MIFFDKALTLALVAVASASVTLAEDASIELTWRSTPDDRTQQTREITDLYLALYNSANLPTQAVINTEGTLLEPLLFKENALIGNGLTPAVSAILCDLNTDICTRKRMPVSPETFGDLTAHVGGFQVSEANWLFSKGDTFVLPGLKLEPYTTLNARPVSAGWNANEVSIDPDLDCSKWGVSCQDLVALLNPPLFKQTRAVSASFPVLGYRTDIVIDFFDSLIFGEALKSRSFIKGDVPENVVAWSQEYTQYFQEMGSTDNVIEALGSNVLIVGNVSRYGVVADESLFDQQVGLFTLINHPFADGKTLDSHFQNKVSILVLDEEFDPTHCDINIDGVDTSGTPSSDGPVVVAGAADDCTEIASLPHPIKDHAPHVVGLIGAPLNGKGMAGLNPYSAVKFGAINPAFASEQDLLDAQTKLQLGAVNNVRVANLSWGFPQLQDQQDLFATAVQVLGKKTLIVAAAGNSGTQLGDGTPIGCPVIPACLSALDNVITVVGLDRNKDAPGLWVSGEQGSNYAIRRDVETWQPAFQIAGIAENVLSTVRNDRFGRMSGTSMAAPQIAAAASLIISAAEDLYPELTSGPERSRPQLAPKVVKDRLTYTSDLFRKLQNEVFGGRLNVNRSINIAATQLVLRDENGPRAVSGRLVTAPSGGLLICAGPDGGSEIKYNWANVRRMHWDKGRAEYVVFYHEAPINDAGSRNEFALRRINDCDLRTRSNEAVLVTSDNLEIPFQLKDILDYTSPLLP